MRYSVAALLALASAVFAQTEGFNVVSKPTKGDKVPAGETYEIVWAPDADYADKPVSIILIGGPTQPEQQVIETIAKGVPSNAGSYTWEVDSSLGDAAVYGLQIVLEEDTEVFQYSFPFAITPDHSGHSSSAPASSAPSTTSAPTKTRTSKSSAYPTSTPSESSTFSSVYYTVSSDVPSSSGSSSVPTESSGTETTATATTSTTATATAAATAFAVNGFAVLGGLAMAALAL